MADLAPDAVDGGVTAARGFLGAGLHCGVKAAGIFDLGVVLSQRPATAAGVFTRNRVAAAPVDICRAHLRDGRARAVIANSGNANACTGEQGRADARRMAAATAARFGLEPADVLVVSTGVIGVPLPLDRIEQGIGQLEPSASGGDDFARAIMTTDTRPKTAALEITAGARPMRIGGAAKGSGMIHPDMATLLAVVSTDAAVEPAFLAAALARAADRSFNLISVDGDTSTNDSLLVLANGAAGGETVREGSAAAETFEAALTAVCVELAKAVARDGEGARSLIEVTVSGATDDAAARRIARSVASSTLVKTAVFGTDPNWGRVLCAAGYAGPELDVERTTLHLGDICLFRRGAPQPYDRSAAAALLALPDVRFALDLGLGGGSGVAWGCDMGYEYIKINAEYTT